ncbi:MAG: hypothetical protein NTZ05_14735, partial [Chloroflexi bacterium]|nr:hypothetical protein [Chloroflexota bacterium]
MSRFDILIYGTESSPVYRGNLGPRAVGLRLSWIHPGGCDTCAFRVYAPINFVPAWIGKFFKVLVVDGGEVIWAGRLEEPLAHLGPDGRYWNIAAKGYAVNLDDQSYVSENVRNTPTGDIVAGVITDLTQQIAATSITATGYTISNAADVNLTSLKAHAAVNWARTFGDSSYNP